ncbi:MAG: DUF1538 domain-containing protein [Myxococcales bacterium]|nr:DUF1538 domain-containing protein [Myxococcales bacterium]
MPHPRSRAPSALSNLGMAGVVSILWRYFREKALEQVKTVWFIIAYLVLFQVMVLNLPVIFGVTIALGIVIVVMGLTFFMEGLRLGLMPFGETIGSVLPKNSKLPLITVFSFLLGLGATFAEPAISVLKKAGVGVSATDAPLLYSLLNDFSGQLVAAVGIGVGVAVSLGILRFFYGWSLKRLLVPVVALLVAATLYAYLDPILNPVIGLAWDCGAVTTGPVTVPLVLALGIGVGRIVGTEDSGGAGFGVVTLASLFPIVAVLGLAMGHARAKDYYGAEHYQGPSLAVFAPREPAEANKRLVRKTNEPPLRFTEKEFREYQESRTLPERLHKYRTIYRGGQVTFEDGRIVHKNAEIVLEKKEEAGALERFVKRQTQHPWDARLAFAKEFRDAALVAAQAILPLCGFLLLTLSVVLRESLRRRDEIVLGVVFAVVGMTLFSFGLTLGLIPLGTQLGSNVPVTFAAIEPWGVSEAVAPIFENATTGKLVTMAFAFFLGYGATLAEPALNALGQTVENVTVGVLRKKLLMHVVAIGVGLGIAAGVAQLAFESLSLTALLVPPYVLLLLLTLISSDEFVNFAWDSAGVTTGPITVPLVLAMGLGIGQTMPGGRNGFGILALASVGPIITVLLVGLVVNRSRRINAAPIGEDAV